MADGDIAPDPREARDPTGFIARLQALKDWSGLTCRELSARAEAAGDVLPRSTVANMLSRTTVPREESLTAFVRACGAGPDALETWLAVRKELAARGRTGPAGRVGHRAAEAGEIGEIGEAASRAGDGGAPAGAGGPDGAPRGAAGAGRSAPGARHGSGAFEGSCAPADGAGGADGGPGWGSLSWPADPGGEGRGGGDGRGGDGHFDGDGHGGGHRGAGSGLARFLVPVVAVLTLVIAVTTVVALVWGPHEGRGEDEGPVPAAGPVRIRATHSGLCLGERPGERGGQVHQVPCAAGDLPRYSLVPLPGGLWRIRSDHPEYGPGCAGVPAGTPERSGAPLVDQECGTRGPAEAFRVEPFAGGGTGGHRIRPDRSGLCLTVRGGAREPWAEVVQETCRTDGEGQLFGFEPRPA
ncbi:RICIN domain-containing protein [Streptomyces sp. HMX112]|uniref:RICIN domain-containing protein n=1 Tax=Streptomyces sp. HMX112 TaxID=3390850 RepID=UPI003A80520C